MKGAPTGGVHQDDVDTLACGVLGSLLSDPGGVLLVPPLEQGHPEAPAVRFQLLHRPRPESIARRNHDLQGIVMLLPSSFLGSKGGQHPEGSTLCLYISTTRMGYTQRIRYLTSQTGNQVARSRLGADRTSNTCLRD